MLSSLPLPTGGGGGGGGAIATGGGPPLTCSCDLKSACVGTSERAKRTGGGGTVLCLSLIDLDTLEAKYMAFGFDTRGAA